MSMKTGNGVWWIAAIALVVLAVALHAASPAAIKAIAGPGEISRIHAANQWVRVLGTVDVLAIVSCVAAAGITIKGLVARRRAG